MKQKVWQADIYVLSPSKDTFCVAVSDRPALKAQ